MFLRLAVAVHVLRDMPLLQHMLKLGEMQAKHMTCYWREAREGYASCAR